MRCLITGLLLFILFMLFVYFIFTKEPSVPLNQEIVDSPKLDVPTTSEDMLDINLHSSNAILVNLDENKVLLDKNNDEVIYPASLTKL